MGRALSGAPRGAARGAARPVPAVPAFLTSGNPAARERTCHLVFASAFPFNTF